MILYQKYLKPIAADLRKNMTPQERKLWYDFLRDLSPRFVRQKPLDRYIADFYCPTRKLVIEVDGGQHYEQTGRENDEWRTQALNQAGICVVRFSNSDVDHHFNEVCASILAVLKMEDSRP